MESFSPATRKLVAVGLLLLVVLLGIQLLLVPAWTLVGASLDGLRDARFRHAHLLAVQARPAPPRGEPVPPELVISAPNAAQAGLALAGVVQAAAAQAGVAVERVEPQPPGAGTEPTIALDLAVNGPEATVATFINTLERGAPLVRLRRWSLSGPEAQGGPVRLEATAAAVWSRP